MGSGGGEPRNLPDAYRVEWHELERRKPRPRAAEDGRSRLDGAGGSRAAALSGHPRTMEPHMLRIIPIAMLLAASLGTSQAFIAFNGISLNGASLDRAQPKTGAVGSAALVSVELPR